MSLLLWNNWEDIYTKKYIKIILCDLFGVVTTKVGGVNAIKILIIGLFIGIFDGY